MSGVFFGKVQLHRELTDLAFQRGDAGLVFGDDAGLGFFTCQLAPAELRQPKLEEAAEMSWLRCASRRPMTPVLMS